MDLRLLISSTEMKIYVTSEMFLWTAVAVAAAVLVLILTRSRRKAATNSRIPPGPPGWPILGNILDLGFKPHKTLVDLKTRYGPLVWLRLGSVNTLVVCSAEAAMEMFKYHDHSTCNRHLNETMKVGGTYGATITLGEYGPYWRMLRRLCVAELFSRKRIIDTAPLRRRCVDKLIKWIDDEAKEQSEHGVELARYVFASAFNVMGNIMLSRDLVDPKSSKGNEFFNLTSELTAITGKPNLADFFPVLRWFDPQGLKKHTEEKKNQVLDIVDSFIEGRRRQDIEGKQSRNKEQKDLLDVLMEFEGNGKDEPAKISDRNLNIFILELFIGASETTNSTVEWAMAELLRQPEAMKKVKAEITKVVGFQRNLEESDIKDLHYLDAVIKETLRLHPPLPLLIPRTTIKDMELMGYIIPKDTQIFINVWGLGRDPCSWEDADSFKPERFIDASNLDYRGQNFDYLPFGAGRRICPGIPLGHQMLHLVLGSLIHSFDWSLANGVTPETLDMGERMGTSLRKDIPLKAIPKPLFI